MKREPHVLPASFKGIALFTPGGDLVYCIDPEKRERWHLHLCAQLQEALNLAEPPYFLTPCYSATIDQWIDPLTHQIRLTAEASPLVLQHQTLLNAVFGLDPEVEWVPADLPLETCNPLFLQNFYQQFPQLWDTHELILSLEASIPKQPRHLIDELIQAQTPSLADGQGYVLRLFLSGNSSGNERTLRRLHQFLETSLKQPYTLKVIDVHKNPELAEADQVSATPTLVKAWPVPVKKLVGDFQDTSSLLGLLLSTDPDYMGLER
ncbi:MAG: circadian clock KaiB family protein [Leptolyngbyaceae bacterium]|nr:circadian clock KaiB family protein [Leptolyngbyaceae bacterium]